jgi:hypothetical protein
MADAPLDFEAAGELPVFLDEIEVITIENLNIKRTRALTPRAGMRKKITTIGKGVWTITFSFKMPVLKTKALTELNVKKLASAAGRPFTLRVSNGSGSITLTRCEIGEDTFSATAMQGDASVDISGQAQEWLD